MSFALTPESVATVFFDAEPDGYRRADVDAFCAAAASRIAELEAALGQARRVPVTPGPLAVAVSAGPAAASVEGVPLVVRAREVASRVLEDAQEEADQVCEAARAAAQAECERILAQAAEACAEEMARARAEADRVRQAAADAASVEMDKVLAEVETVRADADADRAAAAELLAEAQARPVVDEGTVALVAEVHQAWGRLHEALNAQAPVVGRQPVLAAPVVVEDAEPGASSGEEAATDGDDGDALSGLLDDGGYGD